MTPEDISKVQSVVKYSQVTQKLGTSALGNTYEIMHPEYGKCVLKFLEGRAVKNKKFLQRFLQAIMAAKGLDHPNISKIYDIGQDNHFFVLRRMAPGSNLSQKSSNGQGMAVRDATFIMLQLLSGLTAMHALGIVHKNLKPNNVIVDGDNKIKIIDFSLPPTTPHYLSPEQCKGRKSDVRSDIYSLGLIYYHCLAGKAPYAGTNTREIMEAHLTKPCPDISELRRDLPYNVVELVNDMLAKKPEARPQKCSSLLPVFENILKNIDDSADIDKPQPELSEQQSLYDEPTIELVAVEPFVSDEKIDKFKQMAMEMASKLRIVNQTLYMLDNMHDSQDESLLFIEEMLAFITTKTGEILGADRTIIFLLDEQKHEMISIVDKDQGSAPLRIPADEGIAGEVITSRCVVNIPFDFYDDERSCSRKKVDEAIGYRTYTMMALPLVDGQGNPVAVVQLLNKLKTIHDPGDALLDRIDIKGFSDDDEKLFGEFAPSIRLTLESSRSFYRATQRQRAAASLMSAIKSLSQSTLDLQETLDRVMNEAKQLMDADRITLWLLDRDKNNLWANIEMAHGSRQEIRIPSNAGFAGQVVKSGEPLNIPFDLYDHPDSATSKQMDQKTGYRTCSMLCMPVLNSDGQLIGVTQLVNKKRQGDFPAYDPANWPQPPMRWKASFDSTDLEFMLSFNLQAGVALQNAKLFATVKQQEQMQRDILRSLTNGVISTDKQGRVIAANESAKRLLGMDKKQRIENHRVQDLVKIKEGNFGTWLEAAFAKNDEKAHQQYYPEQTLVANREQNHSINLSINTITDVGDTESVRGALVVMDDISDEKRVKSMMYRYMTQEVVEQLLTSGDIKLGGQRKDVTVLFSDIRSYTSLSEGLTAEEVVAMLNEYFEEMVDVVFKYKGTLDKYIGDAIMAVFGSPLPLEDHGWCAVQTAVEMWQRLQKFNDKRQSEGKPKIKIGIGIHTDEVISGNIGSSKRMELTSIGDGVNLASRLESASKQYGCNILISENTYRFCADKIYARELDFVVVKGKTEPVKIYEVVALRSQPLSKEILKLIEHYQQGRYYYSQRLFEQALTEFANVLAIDPHNKASHLHIKRCHQFLHEPPGDDWNGAWVLTSK